MIFVLDCIISHNGLRRMSEHIGNIEVEGTHSVALFKGKVSIASSFTNNIQRSTLALGNLANVVEMLFLNEQSHTLLTFVGYNFFARQSLVTNWQFRHIY